VSRGREVSLLVDGGQVFERESPVCAYWLTRCEGFKVVAGNRELGVVESVACEWPLGRAEGLVLRSGHRQTRLDAGRVLAVVPAQQLLLAVRERSPSRLRPAASGVARAGLAVVNHLAAGLRTAAWLALLAARLLFAAAVKLGRSAGRDLPPAARAAAETIRTGTVPR